MRTRAATGKRAGLAYPFALAETWLIVDPLWTCTDSVTETIQVVLDTKLVRTADGAAKRARVNRSALHLPSYLASVKSLL